MDNTKDDAYYFDRLLKDLLFVRHHMENISQQAFSEDEILQSAMMFRLIQISENARKLSAEYKTSHQQIPWNAVYGLRNRIVHDYGAVDLQVVYMTLANDIPELIELIEN